MAYVELIAASNFSFLRGASHPEELAETAAALGLAAFAICDRNSFAGIVRGHQAAKDHGLRFVPGVRLIFSDGTPDVAAWPRDRDAYGRLCRLLTLGKRRAEKGACRLEIADLLAWAESSELAVIPPARLDAEALAALPVLLARLKEAAPGRVRLALSHRLDGSDRRRLHRLAGLARGPASP